MEIRRVGYGNNRDSRNGASGIVDMIPLGFTIATTELDHQRCAVCGWRTQSFSSYTEDKHTEF